ncbi:MAG: YhdP family protein [Stagnimonas sp.]|nr:YhdP family protein [Stagnimonas sp.]
MDRRKRRWWTRGITWLSALVVLAAAISGLFQLAVLVAPGYGQELSVRVSAEFGRPVRIGSMQLAWRWLWPQLQLGQVDLLADDGQTALLRVERLRLGFAAADLLRGELVPARIDLSGLDLELDLDAEGQLRLRGFDEQQKPPELRPLLRQLRRFERLRAERVSLRIHDLRKPGAVWRAQLSRADLRLNQGAEEGFELRLDAEAPGVLAEHLKLRVGMSGAYDQPEQWSGRWTLDADGLAPAPGLLARLPRPLPLRLGQARLSASGDWQPSALGDSRLRLQAEELRLGGAQPLRWQALDLQLDYQPKPGGGELRWQGPVLTGVRGAWPASAGGRIAWQRSGAEGAPRLEGGTDFLRLDDLAPWLALLAGPDAALKPAQLASLRGDLRELEGRYQALPQASPHYALAAELDGVGYGLAGGPGLAGLSGRLSADESGGQWALRGNQARLLLPAAFAAPIGFDQLSASLRWNREESGWRLRSPDLAWRLLGSEAHAELDLRLPPEGGPQLKLKAQLKAADAARLKPLMPLNWGPSLRAWLERALVRVRVPQAELLIDGPLADFPFHQRPTGRWSLNLEVADARLDYQQDWPAVDRLRAQLKFAGNGLWFEAEKGIISGVAVQGASGHIENFASSPLVIDGRTRGEAAAYYDFLRGSPLAQRLAGLVGHTQGEGPVDTELHLEIPLHSNLGQHQVANGTVLLANNRLRVSGLDEPIEAVNGRIQFGARVSAGQLSAQFYGQPVQADIVVNGEGSDELQARYRVDYDQPQGVAAHYVPAWVLDRLDGASDWTVSLPLGGPHAGQVSLASALQGAVSRLPVPLAKGAEESLSLRLGLYSDDSTPLRLQLEAPGRIGLALRFAREAGEMKARGVGIRLGGGGEAQAPAQDGISLNGRAEQLDIAAWLGLMGVSNESGLPFLGADFSLARLQGLGYELPEVAIKASRSGNGDWRALLDGAHASGSLDWQTGGSGLLRGRFQRLGLQPLPATPKTGGEAAVEPARDPSRLPTVDLDVAALQVGGEDFGRFQMLSERLPGGQRLSRLSAEGGRLKLRGEGEWRRQQGQSTARAKFELDSGDLAASLRGLGFAQTLSGDGHFEADLGWPASASGLSWTQARGPVRLKVKDGALRAVDPGGTARVLGLLNFYALPRRLTLDFRDVTSKGLNFSAVEGHFQLADGDARTEDLVIRSPSLRMELKGRVGLAARDYDQRVTVYPDVSGISLGALLLGGASLATGPLLPLMAVIANQVIDKPLGEVTQLDYRLTGSWDNPEIKRVDDNSRPAAAAPAPASGGRP